MFKSCTLLFLFLGCFITKAQEVDSRRNFERGTFIVGLDGSSGFSFINSYRHPSVSFTPFVGYFVAPNLAAGVRFLYGYESLIAKNGSTMASGLLEYHSNSLVPGVFLRYYTPNWKVKPFVGLSTGVNLQWGKVGSNIGNMEKLKSQNFVGSGEVGVMFPIGKKFSIDVLYSKIFISKSDFPDANKDQSLRLGVSFRF